MEVIDLGIIDSTESKEKDLYRDSVLLPSVMLSRQPNYGWTIELATLIFSAPGVLGYGIEPIMPIKRDLLEVNDEGKVIEPVGYEYHQPGIVIELQKEQIQITIRSAACAYLDGKKVKVYNAEDCCGLQVITVKATKGAYTKIVNKILAKFKNAKLADCSMIDYDYTKSSVTH